MRKIFPDWKWDLAEATTGRAATGLDLESGTGVGLGNFSELDVSSLSGVPPGPFLPSCDLGLAEAIVHIKLCFFAFN